MSNQNEAKGLPRGVRIALRIVAGLVGMFVVLALLFIWGLSTAEFG